MGDEVNFLIYLFWVDNIFVINGGSVYNVVDFWVGYLVDLLFVLFEVNFLDDDDECLMNYF